MRVRVWNGYAYFGLATDVPEAEQEAMWERRTVAARAAIQDADAYWHERAVPEVSAAYAWVAARPVETMPVAGARRDVGRGLGADRALLGDPFLRDPRAVPGPR